MREKIFDGHLDLYPLTLQRFGQGSFHRKTPNALLTQHIREEDCPSQGTSKSSLAPLDRDSVA